MLLTTNNNGFQDSEEEDKDHYNHFRYNEPIDDETEASEARLRCESNRQRDNKKAARMRPTDYIVLMLIDYIDKSGMFRGSSTRLMKLFTGKDFKKKDFTDHTDLNEECTLLIPMLITAFFDKEFKKKLHPKLQHSLEWSHYEVLKHVFRAMLRFSAKSINYTILSVLNNSDNKTKDLGALFEKAFDNLKLDGSARIDEHWFGPMPDICYDYFVSEHAQAADPKKACKCPHRCPLPGCRIAPMHGAANCPNSVLSHKAKLKQQGHIAHDKKPKGKKLKPKPKPQRPVPPLIPPTTAKPAAKAKQ